MRSAKIRDFIKDLGPAFEAGDRTVANKQEEAANVRSVQGQYEAIIRGDFAAFAGTLAEDVEMEIVGPPSVPFVGRWHGREEVVAAVQRNFSWLEDQQPEVQSVVAQGDTVVVVARERGRFRATGDTYDMHWVQVFTFADGKLVRFRQVFDSAPLLAAVRGSASGIVG